MEENAYFLIFLNEIAFWTPITWERDKKEGCKPFFQQFQIDRPLSRQTKVRFKWPSALSKGFLDIQATIECGFTLKCVCDRQEHTVKVRFFKGGF